MPSKLFLSQLKPAFNLCKKNKGFFLLSCFIDLVFFLILLAVNYFFLMSVKDFIVGFIDAVQENFAGVLEKNLTVISPGMIKTPELMSAYHLILKYVVVFVLIALLVWIVFKGINWFIANRLIRKVKPGDFIKRFIAHTFLACICLFIIMVIATNLVAYSSSSFLPLFGSTTARFITLVLIWLLSYFLAVSYSTNLTCKELMKAGIKHYKELVPAHLFIFIGFLLLSYLTVESIKLDFWAPVFFALIITIPFVTYGRIYIVVVVNKVLKRGR
ncbi:hypothetical protein KY338_03410 [Candidatus Woesearchaeota archaeon]|nr:hypothetical protein [Candidatus Woesearchaeota archaeon]MBW3005349.1 hypothetical protein [Candidatus Woesearchaeota archaeon]